MDPGFLYELPNSRPAEPSAAGLAAQMDLERLQKEAWEAAQAQAQKQAQSCDGPDDRMPEHQPPNMEDFAKPGPRGPP